MASGLYWKITRDRFAEMCLKEGDDPSTVHSAVGISGPGIPPADTTLPLIVRFRLVDDDNFVMFEGKAANDDSAEEAYNGFGVPNGCTRVDLWESGTGGGWKQFIS